MPAPARLDNPSAILAFLREGRWFGGLPEALQHAIVERGVVRSFGKGELIIRHGAPAQGMHALLEGRIRATWPVDDNTDVLIHVGEPGVWFGDYATLAATTSISNIAVDLPARTLFLSVAAFERMIDEEPRWFRCFVNLTLERYAMLTRYYAEAQALPSEAWLRTRLRDMAAMRRQDAATSGPIEIAVSQSDLATAVGLSRQTLSALLARLEAQGLIEVGFRSIRVLDDGTR
jgi:CRP-like cAMP-binding protein